MRFSVLVPVYNVEKYLRQCLDSILNQCFDDYELILVNDGSTDGSTAICREYAEHHAAKITLIEQDNAGLLIARRVGIDHARGEYCVCVDSDDALREDSLLLMDKMLAEDDSDVLAFQRSRQPDFGSPFLSGGIFSGDLQKGGSAGLLRARQLLSTTHELNAITGKAIRTACIGQGDDYTEYKGLQYGEDLLQMTSILNVAKTYKASSDILYYYRLNEASISHTTNPSRLDDIVKVRERLVLAVQSWDSSLLPCVYANNCVEVLAYAIRALLSGEESEVTRASRSRFFSESYVRADLSKVASWKRIGITLLNGGGLTFFSLYIRMLFRVIGFLRPEKLTHYR